LEQIRKGKRLKHAETNDKSTPTVAGAVVGAGNTAASGRPVQARSSVPAQHRQQIPGMFAGGTAQLKPIRRELSPEKPTVSIKPPAVRSSVVAAKPPKSESATVATRARPPPLPTRPSGQAATVAEIPKRQPPAIPARKPPPPIPKRQSVASATVPARHSAAQAKHLPSAPSAASRTVANARPTPTTEGRWTFHPDSDLPRPRPYQPRT